MNHPRLLPRIAGIAVAVLVLRETADAQPVASSEQPHPATEPAPAAKPPAQHRDHSSTEAAGAPLPGNESGRTDRTDDGDSAARVAARGLLLMPKLLVAAVEAPIHDSVWAYDRYQLSEVYFHYLFNRSHSIGIEPTADYETGIGAVVGAKFVDHDVFGDSEHFALQGAIGGTYRTSDAIAFDTGHFFGDHFKLGLISNFDRRPSDPFYGIGNGDKAPAPPAGSPLIDPRSDSTAVETFHRYQEARVALQADYRFAHSFHAIVSGALADIEIARSTQGTPIDEIYDPAALVGFETGVEHAYSELDLRYDSRSRGSWWEPRGVYTGGSLVSGFAGRITRLDGGADYWHYGAELQHYFKIAEGPRVIALRFHGEGVTGSLDDVPVVELPMLGGGTFLRGYDFERFRDRVAAVASAQYEWDLSHNVDAYLFVDGGRVYDSLDDLTLASMLMGYGIGMSLHDNGGGFVLEGNLASSLDGGLFATIAFNPILDTQPRWR